MDPNEILKEIRTLVNAFQNTAEAIPPTTTTAIYATKLANFFAELDDHLSSGGMAPEDWMGDFDI